MKIYCKTYNSMSEVLQRYAGKDLWFLAVILQDIPNPNDTADVKYEPLPEGQYYIQILSVDGDTCQAYLWDKDYFDYGAKWYVTVDRVQETVYTIFTNNISFYYKYPEVLTTAELAEQFEHNVKEAETQG